MTRRIIRTRRNHKDHQTDAKSDKPKMKEAFSTVAIVVNPDFGEQLLTLADAMAIWIVDTPANRKLVDLLSSQSGSNRFNVTTFRVKGDDRMRWCREVLPQVDLHHGEYSANPAYDSVEVFGISYTKDLRDAFLDYGLKITSERADGFRAVR